MAPFVMSVTDLNKSILRQEPTSDIIQQIINEHTYEDATHLPWYLEDLEKLNLDQIFSFKDTLRFIWSRETKAARQLVYCLIGNSFKANPIEKLIITQVLEAAGNVFFVVSTQVVNELKLITQKKYRYFGEFHLMRETGHVMCTTDIEQITEKIQMSEEACQYAFELVEQVFKAFTEFANELFTYAQIHQSERIKPQLVDVR
ncbi:hypothetical protein [Nostoc sp. FACHB-888]|uniref:hypothetical protein n=1 Tax=Nostoc sp. FACHB-888 TaxID=2692842 RepID=UPI001683C238|nr:hypothetical protein [Nostoc sp. FACHB-888]MBD2247773.1 hypothetical protein [Nostoc sp. FACHB-888]